MNIDSIKNGIVIDHISAGNSLKLYQLLKLDELDCSVAIIKNVASKKTGKKDIIKIDADIAPFLFQYCRHNRCIQFALTSPFINCSNTASHHHSSLKMKSD